MKLKNYNQEISKVLKELSVPLLENFSDFSVGYKRCYHDGSFLMIETKHEWHDLYLSRHFYDGVLHDNLDKTRTYNNEYVYILSGEPSNKIHAHLFELDVWNSISLHYPHESYEEAFHFCTTRNNHELINLYVNNRGLFHHLILYLRERFLTLKIQEAPLFVNTNKTSGIPLKADTTSTDESSVLRALPYVDLKAFFSATSIKRFYFDDDDSYLTKRELECIYYLCQGFTMKHIARILQISPRTVEFHINEIKNRVGIQYKNELLTFFHHHFPESYFQMYEKYCFGNHKM